ncbi:MAG TPA: FAD-dependent oxidoreductase, partial [Bdellovibrionota bacterium]|nr:FAD-dependent oxidoreductase [Bdellovibrionota bacterium]
MSEKVKAVEFKCEVVSNVHVTPTVFLLHFRPSAPLPFKAGQFISIVVPGAGPGGRNLRRAYSIASNPERNPIELCVKLVEDGPGTNYLHGLKAGDTFTGFAPYGDFVYVTDPSRSACFISTGTGIAPFRAMLQSQAFKAAPPKKVISVFGVRDQSEDLYREELREYAS